MDDVESDDANDNDADGDVDDEDLVDSRRPALDTKWGISIDLFVVMTIAPDD